MTIPSSTIPAARDWLLNAMTVQLTPDPVDTNADLLVCLDGPGPNAPDDIVSIGEFAQAYEPGSFTGDMGAGAWRERYSITIDIDVFRGSDDAKAVADRARTLIDGIIAVVRADPTLGGAVLTAKPVSSTGKGEWDPEHLGRHWVGAVEISVYAQI
jgi:hypothetical protein